MLKKDIVFKALSDETPDYVPNYEASIDNLKICNFYHTKYQFQSMSKFVKKKIYLRIGDYFSTKKPLLRILMKRIFKLYSRIGLDLFCSPLDFLPFKWENSGFIDEFGRKFKIYKDEKYKIDTIYYEKGIFESYEDYRDFPKPNPDNIIKENIFKVCKSLEEKYNICCGFVIMGIFESVWQSFNMPIFSRMVRNGFAKRMIDDRALYLYEIIKRIIEWNNGDSGIIFLSDDYGYKSGLFMKPQYYREWIMPHIKKACDLAHKGNLKVIMHSCGDIYDIFDDLVKCNIDAIHPIEPTTSNPKYNIFNLHKKYGDKLTFIGNVSPQHLAEKDPQFICNYVKKLLENLSPNGRFILSSGHSINPAVKLENFLAMRNTLNLYNKISC